MDGFYKEARITTVDEPYLKPISDEGIGFIYGYKYCGINLQVRREITGKVIPRD